jgi:hypothetical protein
VALLPTPAQQQQQHHHALPPPPNGVSDIAPVIAQPLEQQQYGGSADDAAAAAAAAAAESAGGAAALPAYPSALSFVEVTALVQNGRVQPPEFHARCWGNFLLSREPLHADLRIHVPPAPAPLIVQPQADWSALLAAAAAAAGADDAEDGDDAPRATPFAGGATRSS